MKRMEELIRSTAFPLLFCDIKKENRCFFLFFFLKKVKHEGEFMKKTALLDKFLNIF